MQVAINFNGKSRADARYCFLPSLDAEKGEARAYDHVPSFVKDFSHHSEIEDVSIFPLNISEINIFIVDCH